MRNEIPEGYELVVGHSTEKAREALSLAEDRGLAPETVLRSTTGYLVPEGPLGDPVLPPANVEEARERAAAAAAAAEASQGGTEEVEVEALELPKKTATNEEIDAWRDEHLPGFEYPEDATNKDLRLAALAAEVERHTARQDAENAAAEAEGRTPELLAYEPETKED